MYRLASKALNTLFSLAPFAAFATFVTLLVMGFTAARNERVAYVEYERQRSEVAVSAPESIPHMNQRSIDVAVEIFSIDLPANVEGPTLDRNLYDRGLTTGDSLGNKKFVTIGPAAFTSWGILGSTLGHEVEIHAKQSFFKIVMMDKLAKIKMASKRLFVAEAAEEQRRDDSDDGTFQAEREAYHFELSHSERFNLTEREKQSIEQIVRTYYPDRPDRD